MKKLANEELNLHAQWKVNSFPKVSYTKLLSHIITKNCIVLDPPQDTTNTYIDSEIKI